ncbi:MAG TPA: lamin tail domain-containing protein, partial [Planctomycetota bacterium]|nr:lamin tail domain-containing protein [Planctomycetota bacterium]
QVEITFSEDVLGVGAADLVMAGRPSTSVTGAGAGPYTFLFSQPPPGAVDVAWTPGHGITDLSEHPNSFAGGGWTYNLDPGSPPAELVIGELLASNGNGLRDEDGEASDWIEIENRGKLVVNLSGWSLTDDRTEPGKWTFPEVSIGPGEFLVIFASGKDRRPSFGGILHLSFKLSAAGEYLGLYTPESPRQVLHEFAAQFPEQRRDISYGLDASGMMGYFEEPTPGAANGEGLSSIDFAADPELTPGHGFFTEAVSVEIGTRTPGAAIYYSLDGSEPTPETGTPYTMPIEVAGTPRRGAVVLRAVTYKEGYLPSNTSTATYIFPEHVLTQPADPDGFPRRWGSAPAVDYEMDPEIVNDPAHADALRSGWAQIPAVSLVMHVDDMFGPQGIYSNPQAQGPRWERAGSAELLFPDGRRGFQVGCGIQIQGGASREPAKSPKHAFRVLFKGDYGPTRLRYRLFPDSAVDEFDVMVLRAGFNNTWIHWNGGQRARAQFTHDQWARDTQLDMGQASPHGIYAHVFLNGLYWGIYNVIERPNDAFGASYLGGEKEEYDALNAGIPISGNSLAWSAMLAAVNVNLAMDGPYRAVQSHLDLAALADYMILNFYGSNQDWPGHNWYALRKREPGAPFFFISWDAERILEDIASNRTGVTDPNTPGQIFSRLKLNPEFRLLFADRVQRHLFASGALTPEAAAGRLTERNGQIDDAVVLESARWGDYRRDVHRWQDPPFELYKRDVHWVREQSRLLTQYFPRRTDVVLNQFRQGGLYPATAAPLFGQHGGEIAPGFALSLSLPAGAAGSIHYTTDGSDPRVYGSGEVAATAALYTSPLILGDLTVVKARTLSGAIWSALAEATFKLPSSLEALNVTEIMYNPEGGKDYEFIELKNTGTATLDLSGMRFTNGIEHTFAQYTHVRPGAFVVLVSNEAAFAERYPAVAPSGVYSGSLENSGERITLESSSGGVVLSFEYNDGDFWPIAPDGFGRSLVLAEAQGSLDHPETWRASSAVDG